MSETLSTDRSRIAAALTRFNAAPLADAARELFRTLGYGSDRFQTYAGADEFLELYDREGKVRTLLGKAARKGTALLQQLTSDDIASNSSGQLNLMDGAGLDTRLANSYLLLALPLDEKDPSRARLAEITRAINGLFMQPLLVLFRHGDQISLALTYRRRNKRDASKDVIERKVTLIMGVSTSTPHPGHASILRDFALTSVAKALKREVNTFDDLDEAWRTSLSTQLLNERFYLDIANWYFHAREHAKFPKDAPLDPDGKPSLPIIRLLTRVVFCWFLKEKHLIPDALFDPEEVRKLLKDAGPQGHSYYTAILQNLFFATLNTEMDGGENKRRFIENADKKHSDDHMVHHLWRHAGQLADVKAFEELMRPIPFLNGGLFECLDDRLKQGKSPHTREVRVDGFSEDPAKQPKLPNFLFFGEAHEEDLSDVYGDKRRKKEAVYPLLTILRRYKFTLTENTPIEEEVALDPELLGHVFENLLAAYNPETGTVARKATGSFYTPRVVVDWMVDQALLVHLRKQLPEALRPSEDELKRLVSWEEGPELTPKQCEAIVQLVNSLRSIDPACGSGAFLMGLLQKLVHVLQKVDPQNKRWRQLQVKAAEAIPSATGREAAQRAIERAFQQDNDDYGRKLYLIENGIYGVDIQPIAVQIAKLRFFISLIVDQRIRYDKPQENYGILSLPNLETQIVAADSLMGMENVQLAAASDRAIELAGQLRQVRHLYFTARRYSDKKALRKRDEELREALRAEMEDNRFGGADAQRLAHWNPYDTNRHAPFFSPVWMFGIEPADRVNAEGVFDIVISNPPYVRQETLKHLSALDSEGVERPLKDVLEQRYACYTSTADLYVYFFERSFQLLKLDGVLSTITSNKYFRSTYGQKLRTYLAYATRLHTILDFSDAPVFTAIAYPCILVAQKTRHVPPKGLPKQLSDRQLRPAEDEIILLRWREGPSILDFPEIFLQEATHLAQRELDVEGWKFGRSSNSELLDRVRAEHPGLYAFVNRRLYYGIKTGLNELKLEDGTKEGVFVIDGAKRKELIAAHVSSKELIKPLLRGRDLKRWKVTSNDKYMVVIPSSSNQQHRWSGLPEAKAEKLFGQEYPAIARHLSHFKAALKKRADQGDYYWELRSCDYYPEFEEKKIVFPDIAPSPQFAWDTSKSYLANTAYICIAPKYTLAILNSSVVEWYYRQVSNSVRGGYLRFIRQYVEGIPIPKVGSADQEILTRLVEALHLLNLSGANVKGELPRSLMQAYFEEWINGLVYELYFTEELHGRGLRFFDISRDVFKNLGKEPNGVEDQLAFWHAVFKQVHDNRHALRNALFDLKSLPLVNDIEAVSKPGSEELSIAAEP